MVSECLCHFACVPCYFLLLHTNALQSIGSFADKDSLPCRSSGLYPSIVIREEVSRYVVLFLSLTLLIPSQNLTGLLVNNDSPCNSTLPLLPSVLRRSSVEALTKSDIKISQSHLIVRPLGKTERLKEGTYPRKKFAQSIQKPTESRPVTTHLLLKES